MSDVVRVVYLGSNQITKKEELLREHLSDQIDIECIERLESLGGDINDFDCIVVEEKKEVPNHEIPEVQLGEDEEIGKEELEERILGRVDEDDDGTEEQEREEEEKFSEDGKDSLERQRKVAEFANLCYSVDDIDYLVEEAVERVSNCVDADHVCVFEADEEGFVVKSSNREEVTGKRLESDEISHPEYTTMVGEPVLFGESGEQREFSPDTEDWLGETESGVGAVIGEEDPFGVLGVYSEEKNAFDEKDEVFIRSMANPVACAIERENAKTELRHERDSVSALLETTGGLIVVLDTEGRIVRFNRASEEKTGYSEKEVKGEHFWDIFLPPEEREEIKKGFMEMIEGKFPSQTENHWTTKDGEKLLISWSNTALTDDDGEVEFVIATGIDITERKKAEEKVKERKEKIEELHDIASEMMSCKSEEEVYNITVEAAERILEFDICGIDIVEDEVAVPKAVSTGMPEEGYKKGELEGGLAEKTYRQKESYVVDDVKEINDADPVERGYRSALSVPVGEIGVFQAASKEVEEFDEDDIELTEILMSHAAQSVERIRSEEARRENERMFSTLISNLPGMVYRCRFERGWPMEFVSEGCRELTGYEAEELMEDEVIWGEDILHPDDRDEMWRRVQEAVQEKRPFEVVYRIKTRDDEVKWMWERGRGIPDENGELDALEGFITDITNRKEMEKSLRETNQKLRGILNASPLATVAYDAQNRIRIWNPAAERTFGWKEDEVVGEFAEIAAGENREKLENLIETVRESGEMREVEMKLVRKNGTKLDASISLAPFSGGDDYREEKGVVDSRREERQKESSEGGLEGDEKGVICIISDITERKEREQRLGVLNRVLRHNLRNEMNVVLGHAQLLEGELEDKNKISKAVSIEKKAKDVVGLSNKVQKIEQALDSGKKENRPIELVNIVERKLDKVSEEYPDSTIEISSRHPDEAWVYADALFEFVVENLIENAIEHNDQKVAEVNVSVEKNDRTVEMTIKDNGPGIPKEEREVLTEGRETSLHHGSGLGLWLVNWIAKKSGGELEFDDNEPRGSIVRMRLRRAEKRTKKEIEKVGRSKETEENEE